MACEVDLWNAFDAGKAEGVCDHRENHKAFNDVVDPRVPIDKKRAALGILKKNNFKKTTDALTTWLDCVTLASSEQ